MSANDIDWSKEFPITSVTREDLISAGFPQEIVETLTDAEIQEIASKIEDAYLDNGSFWEDLELYTNRTLERKKEDAVLEHGEQSIGDKNGLT